MNLGPQMAKIRVDKEKSSFVMFLSWAKRGQDPKFDKSETFGAWGE